MTDPNTKKQIEYLTNRIKELEEQIEKSISFSLEKNKLIKDLNKSEERFKKLSMLAMEGILLHTKGIAED
ncbi:MAG: hypothetical protein JW857_00005, partial [Bacteroidales bacterium]|nr:hypothetical protein [Bacteroidales bacterium]